MSDELDPKIEGEGDNSENTEQASSTDEPTSKTDTDTKTTSEPVPDVPDTTATDAAKAVEDDSTTEVAKQEEVKAAEATTDHGATEPEAADTAASPAAEELMSQEGTPEVTEAPAAVEVTPAAAEEQPASDAPAAKTDEEAATEESPAPESATVEEQPASETPAAKTDEVAAAEESPAPESATVEEQPAPETPLPKSEADTPITDGTADRSDTTAATDASQEVAKPEEEEHEELEEKDYHSMPKAELVTEIESLLDYKNYRKLDKVLKELRASYDDIHNAERKIALEKFVADGGEESDFDYKPDDLDNHFEASYTLLNDRKSQFFRDQERQKEANYQRKQDILEKLRELVDSEESNASINTLKELQQDWKTVGPIPSQHVKTLWANYNALLDRFYDQRSIYFELKELDRKKNLTAKNELVAKAEKLSEMESIKDAIKELNDLHEEFKHIGPVPKDDQEPLWQRFKAASDKVYERRNEFYEGLRKELDDNLIAKQALVDKVAIFVEFDSTRISEWNQKTKEILEIQKEWEQAGRLPREKAKEINKHFWSNFKGFFNNKGNFFKKLEGQREENLEKKRALVEQADALKDSTDWNATADKLKKLQKEWKDIGSVPEKYRNEVYEQFKAACDHFFNQRRQVNQDKEKEFQVNLEKKLAILDEIEKLAESEGVDKDQIEALLEEYTNLGFVPRNAIKSTQKRYESVLQAFVKKNKSIDEEDLKALEMRASINKIKSGPNAGNKLFRKEMGLKKQIQQIEGDISTWKNNLEFFASSKTADKMKQEFQAKIDKATEELIKLKEQLKILRRANN